MHRWELHDYSFGRKSPSDKLVHNHDKQQIQMKGPLCASTKGEAHDAQ